MKIILSPHLDDETIALGGSIAKWVNKDNEKVLVICLIDDDFTPKGKNDALNPQKIRREEIEKVSNILNFKYIIVYENDNIDGDLRRKNYREVIWKIENIIARETTNENSVEVYFPSKSSHQDHNATNELGRIMMRVTRKIEWDFYEYFMPWDFKEINEGEIYNNVTKYIGKKNEALNIYKSQMRETSVLSIDFIIGMSRLIGTMIGIDGMFEVYSLKRKVLK